MRGAAIQIALIGENQEDLRAAVDDLKAQLMTFASVRSVRDGTGMRPLRYQPGYLDPLGRTIELSFRKLF